MFGFGKKEKKPLFIRAKDVFAVIREDYEDGVAFCIAEFTYKNRSYQMGSCLMPGCDEAKENIFFVFGDREYATYEEFAANAIIDGVRLEESGDLIEITRAGIIDGDAAIKTPWDDTRLARLALKEP